MFNEIIKSIRPYNLAVASAGQTTVSIGTLVCIADAYQQSRKGSVNWYNKWQWIGAGIVATGYIAYSLGMYSAAEEKYEDNTFGLAAPHFEFKFVDNDDEKDSTEIPEEIARAWGAV